MKNREITYYSLLSSENLRHIENVADTMDAASFIALRFEEKWFCHLWIGANNEAFLSHISEQTDLQKIDKILGEQIKLYARKKGVGHEKNKGDFYGTYKACKDWLTHTIFICRNEYENTKNEVFAEAAKWCYDWQNEWLETFNPYSPMEEKELGKDLKTPLWQQLNENLEPEQIKSNGTGKIKSTFRDSMKNGINMKLAFNPDDGFQIIKRYGCADHNKYVWRFEQNISHIKNNSNLFKSTIEKELTEVMSDLMNTENESPYLILDEVLKDEEKLLTTLKEVLSMYNHFDESQIIEFYDANIERLKKIKKVEYLQIKLESGNHDTKQTKQGENSLLQNNESLPNRSNANSINGKKFYTPVDFKQMIVELLKLDQSLSFYVTDFLEFHYSQAGFTNWWSQVNWFTMFRKTLFENGYRDDKNNVKNLPPQIRNAFHWEKQKSFALIKAHNNAKQIKQREKGSSTIRVDESKKYSHPQIAIAYFVMNKTITKENAVKILEKHSQNKSVDKLLQKLISRNNQLTKSFDNKTTNTKHLNNLIAAKRLISGMKIKSAITDIDRIITAFKTDCEKND